MKKIFQYCDYCGVKITNKNKVRNIKTIWKVIYENFIGWEETRIEGDGCIDCYNSYLKWKRSRKIKGVD